MIYIRHYFPGIKLENISDEEFAMLSEEALWLHQQMISSRMTNALFTTATPQNP